MPSHEDDTRLILDIVHIIYTHIIAHPDHTHIICGNLKKYIALIEYWQNEHSTPSHNKKKGTLGGEHTQ